MAKDTDMSSWFFNQNFNGVADDFFDGQPFDFSSVLADDNGEVEDWGVKFESIELPTPDALASLSSDFEPQGCNGAKRNLASLNLEDTDSRSSAHQSYSYSSKESCVIQSSSPNSVLESNGSSSNSAAVGHPVPFNPEISVPTKRRSKRPRGSSPELRWNRSPASNLFLERSLNLVKRKERKTAKRKCLSSDANRKCTHCHATETPQWREGPKGPKTLCNACGVRYRSGRLFPEYRPLASPTFVASMHSNSYKKVAELRKKAACGEDVRDSIDNCISATKLEVEGRL